MKPCIVRLALLLGAAAWGMNPLLAAPSMEELISDLTGNDEKARIAAASVLSEMGPLAEPAVPALITGLKRDDLVLQHECVIALGRIGPPAAPAVPALSRLLGGRVKLLEHDAIHALRLIGPDAKAAVPRLESMVENSDVSSSVAAAWALSVITSNDPKTIEPLIQKLVSALENPSQEVRNDAVSALASIGKPAVSAVAATIGKHGPEVCYHAADALAEIGPDADGAVPTLLKSLDDKDNRVCWHAARALGAIGSNAEAVVPALVDKLDAESPLLRGNVAMALARFGPESASAVPKLIPMLKDSDPNLRVAAARTLGAIGPAAEAAVPALDDALEDEVGTVTFASAEALGGIGKPAVPVLAARLEDENLRPLVAAVLGEIGPDAVGAVPQLLKLLDSEERSIRVEAVLAISNMGPAARGTAAPALMKRLSNPKDESRAGAIYTLAKIGASEAVPSIRRILEEGDDSQAQLAAAWALVVFEPENPKIVAEALPRLKAALRDDWELIRRESLSAIAMVGPAAKSAVPAVAKTLDDENGEVRAEALYALTEIGAPQPMIAEAAIKAVADPDPAVRSTGIYALGRIGAAAKPGVPQLQKYLDEQRDPFQKAVAAWALVKIDPTQEHVDQAVPYLAEAVVKARRARARIEAASTLGEIGKGSDVAKEALEQATEDPDPSVREAAKAALEQLGA